MPTQNNENLLEQLKSGFKSCNKYQRKVSTERVNQFLVSLIDPSFKGLNRLFVLSFDFTTCCLLDYNYVTKNYKIMAIDLRKQQALYSDSKLIQ